MLKDMQKIKGHIKLRLFDEDGNLKQEHDHSNTITTTMDLLVADTMSDGAEPEIGC